LKSISMTWSGPTQLQLQFCCVAYLCFAPDVSTT
jgi:hypothetical protein